MIRRTLREAEHPALSGHVPDGMVGFGGIEEEEEAMAVTDRLPWASAALATGGLSLLLWALVIGAIAALG